MSANLIGALNRKNSVLEARVEELETNDELLRGVNKDQAACIARQNARVAELEADKLKGLDMIRDQLDADPTTVTEAVEGLIKLYKIEFDERFAAETRVAVLEATQIPGLMSEAPKDGPGVIAWTGKTYGYLIVMWTGTHWSSPDVVGRVNPEFFYLMPPEPNKSGEGGK